MLEQAISNIRSWLIDIPVHELLQSTAQTTMPGKEYNHEQAPRPGQMSGVQLMRDAVPLLTTGKGRDRQEGDKESCVGGFLLLWSA